MQAFAPGRRTLVAAALVCALSAWIAAPARAGEAKTSVQNASVEKFKQLRKTRKAFVFRVRGIEPREVRRAQLKIVKKGGRRGQRRVSALGVRRAARGKVRRVRSGNARKGRRARLRTDNRLKIRRTKRDRRAKLVVMVDEESTGDSSTEGGSTGGDGEGPGDTLDPGEGCVPQLAALTAPGCALAFSDTSGEADPNPVWGNVECASDSRAERLGGGADPHPTASGASQGDDLYRRLTVLDGDDFYGERCELGRNDHRISPVALYHEGQRRVTFLSFRAPANLPLLTDDWQVAMQMKQTQPSANGGGTPVLALHISEGRWHLRQSASVEYSSRTQELWSAPAQAGTWTRFAFDIRYSQDPAVGYVRVYADLNGDGDASDSGEQSPEFRTYTLKRETDGGSSTDGIAPGESIPSHLRAGVYHNPLISCPAPAGCSIEMDNVQVVSAP